VDAIERGEIDAIFLIQGVQSGNIKRLLQPDLHLPILSGRCYRPAVSRTPDDSHGGLDLKRNFRQY
jgi:hypothetical protein